MALYVLGDTHLSLGASKPMDVFPGWNGYVERLERNWRKLIKPEDTIVLAGDKFPRSVLEALGHAAPQNDFESMQELEAATGRTAPASLAALRQKAERFNTVIDPEQIAQVALSYQE